MLSALRSRLTYANVVATFAHCACSDLLPADPLANTLQMDGLWQNVKRGETGISDCGGGPIEEPKAKPGYLCIYGRFENAFEEKRSFITPLALEAPLPSASLGDSVTGASGGKGSGTWAVTTE
jgi:hypothetical protein